MFHTIFLLLLINCYVHGAPLDDAVTSLPGFGVPPAPQYSGFLDATAADPSAGVHLHYWFASTESTDPKAPVILWLNGGPGSSSILGMLQENGPLLINATGGLMKNPYAWTKKVNLVILESPSGVGYSYCANSLKSPPAGCINTDNSTARAARAAMQDFFNNKFPELKARDFFITGESYAGVYVPTLAREILDNAPEINIKGVAVGDPCTDNEAQKDSMDMIWYGHKNGFIPDELFDTLWNKCQARHVPHIAKGKWSSEQQKHQLSSLDMKMIQTTPECVLAQRKYLASTSRGFSQSWTNAWINDLTLFGPAAVVPFNMPGSLNYKTAQYMMNPEVKKALHVDTSPAKTWPGPGDHWSYTSQWAACNSNAKPGTPSMIDFYRNIAPRLKTTIVFNGDTDPCVSYEGTRDAIKNVGFNETIGGSYRPWFFNATASTASFLAEKPLLYGPALSLVEAGPQFGGHVVNYNHNLSFVTIHGSGHMVPQFRPRAAYKLLHHLITGDHFAVPILNDNQLMSMSDNDFDKWLDGYTVNAKESV
jgi:serine carboxypeptidase-like clade 1